MKRNDVKDPPLNAIVCIQRQTIIFSIDDERIEERGTNTHKTKKVNISKQTEPFDASELVRNFL